MATNLLIPKADLAKAIRKGACSCHELAEYFRVEEYMVKRKFHLLRTDFRERRVLRMMASELASIILGDAMHGEAS